LVVIILMAVTVRDTLQALPVWQLYLVVDLQQIHLMILIAQKYFY
jgi:hypothetical protein